MKNVKISSRLARFCFVSNIVILCSCQSTGDPRQGGLFRWSENKAISEQKTLEERADMAVLLSKNAQQEYASLSTENKASNRKLKQLKSKLENLLQYNEKLKRDYNQLLSKQSNIDARLAQLIYELNEYEYLNSINNMGSMYYNLSSTEKTKIEQAVQQVNVLYKQAIILMSTY